MELNRHIWEEGSIHRSICGDEYDRVCDIAEQLEYDLMIEKQCSAFATTCMRKDQASLAEAREEIERFREVLKDCEWEGHDAVSGICCPICGNFQGGEHREDCTLKAALKAEKDETLNLPTNG